MQSSAGLLVALDAKLARVGRHWAQVDEALPPRCPLLLLSGVDRGGFDGLAAGLPGLRGGVRRAQARVALARAEYERRKGRLHGWLCHINVWMRANYQGTNFFALTRPVPGRGASYGVWSDAALSAWVMWRSILEEPKRPVPGWEWPLTLGGDGGSIADFEAAMKAFDEAYQALGPARAKVKLARGALEQAQSEAAALLMAYGHGVRARLGPRGALVRGLPQLWPRRRRKRG